MRKAIIFLSEVTWWGIGGITWLGAIMTGWGQGGWRGAIMGALAGGLGVICTLGLVMVLYDISNSLRLLAGRKLKN
jgi:hypothetical protein